MFRGIIFSTVVLLSQIVMGQSAIAVDKVVITVSDLDVSVPFYEEVLGFKKNQSFTIKGKELEQLLGIRNKNLSVTIVELQLGSETIALQEFDNELQDRPVPFDSKSNDHWFQHMAIAVSDMDKAYKKLWDAGVPHVSTAPQTLPAYITEAAGIKAFYFQDPDRHNIEIIYFPNGKGDPKWQQGDKGLFMGIDHTAIGIEKTEPSLEFYENILGLEAKGHSENYGPEQEHLNQVFGARLWITGLRAKKGIGVEFLDYIAPPGGRPYPKDSAPTDLWHWHTIIKVGNLKDAFLKLQQANATFVSNGIVNLNGTEQFMVRDVDGHAILITE
ncbi:VOC family protein [Flagellimonas sp. CMM7]|uniref:VOC family protein n=1 Tax=Flagellimonas sp. CMM7 TaxID=2654676 RepID=UPI0013D59F93|nr:VOC family protein [Flagellimonas sp. CMM7]UII80325.1 VOC family protein [Flagellimonas sp. CMM7]